MSEVVLPKLNLYKLEHLALQIKFPSSKILEIVEQKENKVNSFSLIKVKNGIIKAREINYPNMDYKILQRKFNKFLGKKFTFANSVCGGIVNKNLFDMVKVHCGKETIYQVDLKDFYPNIKFDRILKLFLKCNCSKPIAQLLTELVTYKGMLPQGFVTSTIISNIVSIKLDVDHENICKKNNISRTRWIDDIIFSGRKKDLENNIAKINKSIISNGFIINELKSKFIFRKDRPNIVGLQAEKHSPFISEKIVSEIEDILYSIINNGLQFTLKETNFLQKKKNPQKSLEGKINHIFSFNKNDGEHLKTLYNLIKWN